MIVVLGGAITLLYQNFNRIAEERAAERRLSEQRGESIRALRQDYMSQLIAEYNRTKRARRLLRARALVRSDQVGEDQLRVDKYDTEMQGLLDAQLSLETIAYSVKAEPELFPTNTSIPNAVTAMEKYLRSMVSEYEERVAKLPTDSPPIPLRTFPRLSEFVGPYQSATGFRKEFVHCFHAALSDLQLLITSSPRVP